MTDRDPLPEPETFAELSPPYATIVADPPWPYRTSVAASAAIQTRFRDVGAMGYSVMSMADLCAMPVASLAAPDAHLYMWTTNAFLVEAHELMAAWGFAQKTMLTWVKVDEDDASYVTTCGPGFWFRGATEHVLFGVRGSLKLTSTKAEPTALLAPRKPRRHSAKPAAFGDLVERCSPGPYVELFARAPRLGWDSWGLGYEAEVAS